jgi:uncharacterized protein (TIGR02145 family)
MKTQVLILSMLFAGFASINAQTTMNIYQSNGTVLQIPISSIDSITYTINNPGNLSTITTLPIGNTTSTSASTGGSISATSGSAVTQRGVCWSTAQNPTTANSSTNDGNGTGSFTSNLTGLTANTTYYVRAYAINSAGTAYGNQLSFTTTNSGSSIVSNPGAGVTYNGYTYNSVVLGNGQEWMSENLRSTIYANGDPIPNVSDTTQWVSLTSGAWLHYNNDSQYETPFGKLYNWYAAADQRNVCPAGWHVPSDAEWTILTDYLGGEQVAGGKMKSTGIQYWQGPNTDATNESGFSGLPGGGYYDFIGGFISIGNYGTWWSTSALGNDNAYGRNLSYNGGIVNRPLVTMRVGITVRCLRN